MPSTVRIFVAIEMPREVQEALRQVIEALRAGANARARWVRPENAHLTLRFLGDMPTDRVTEIVEATRAATATARPHSLTLGGLGAFPNSSRPRVIWIGLDGDLEPLSRCQAAVEAGMRRLGLPPADHPFSAHLTLGRLGRASERDRRAAAEALGGVAPPRDIRFDVQRVTVMRSTLRPEGAVHTPVARLEMDPDRRGEEGTVEAHG